MTYDPTIDGAVRKAGDKRAPRPKDAATLILVRHDRGGPQVLMGQRHAGHAFMPNKYVFPGGRVDRGDYKAAVAAELRPDVAAPLAAGGSERRARALAIAAIRETREEAGLILGRPQVPGGDILPALDVLDYVFRAITPPYRPKRFDARFFMADAHHLASVDLDALGGSGELLTLKWVTTEEAQTLDLPNITKMVMREIEARLTKPDPSRPIPFTRFIRGKAVVDHIRK
jgi:8-oxo-dGTP pyrophosphatase MutT (NUDIX family)